MSQIEHYYDFISYCEVLYGQYDIYDLDKSFVVFGKYLLILGNFMYILLGKLLRAVVKQKILFV